jgi:hypothetical protein
MGRDPHRAPGRLAPLRPDYERGTPRQPTHTLPQPERSVPIRSAPEPPDVIEEEVVDYEPPPPAMSRERREVPPRAADCAEEEPTWSADDTQPKMRVFAPSGPRPEPEPEPEPDNLSIQERHQLLIHTIQLYEEEWKLAGIRANPKNNRLQAFLIPRNKKFDLKEAISKNQALIITIDPRGNTEVREPKKFGLLKKIVNWLIGDN